MRRFKVGDYVKFGHPDGSTGRIIEVIPDFDGPLASCHVEWVYGTSRTTGEVIKAKSWYVRDHDLLRTTEDEYAAVRDGVFNKGG